MGVGGYLPPVSGGVAAEHGVRRHRTGAAGPDALNGMSDDIASLQAAYDRLKLLYQVSNVIHSTLDPQQALQLILQEAVRLMRASSGSVALINPNNGLLEIHASAGLPPNAADLKLRVGQGITGWVARTGKPARVGDVRKDPRYVMLRRDVRSELAVPLEVMGEVRGVLNVDSADEDAFSESDQELLEELAVQAAKVIQNTWLFEQSRLKARLLETLVSVSRTINSALNVNEALQLITREACTLMEARMCSLLMLDETGQWLDLRASPRRGRGLSGQTAPERGRKFHGHRRPPQKADATGERANLRPLPEHRHGAARRAGFAVERAAGFRRADHRHAQRLYRRTPQLFQRGNPHPDRPGRAFGHRHGKGAPLRARRGCRGAIASKRKTFRPGPAGGGGRARNPQSAHGHENALPFPRPGILRRATRACKDDAILREKMEHLNKIVEQILDFARSTEPKLSAVNINQLLDDLAPAHPAQIAQPADSIPPRAGADLPEIMADATQLAQAFLNLTLNAVEAMPKGGMLTISTRAFRLRRGNPEADAVLIEFRDTGQGMPEEQRRRRFPRC